MPNQMNKGQGQMKSENANGQTVNSDTMGGLQNATIPGDKPTQQEKQNTTQTMQ